jgi:hypothetical protein
LIDQGSHCELLALVWLEDHQIQEECSALSNAANAVEMFLTHAGSTGLTAICSTTHAVEYWLYLPTSTHECSIKVSLANVSDVVAPTDATNAPHGLTKSATINDLSVLIITN